MAGTQPLAPLRGVPDTDADGKPFCRLAPNFEWELTLTRDDLERRFPHAGRIREVAIAQRTAGGHVQQVRLRGDRATLTLTGAEFRTAIGVGRIRSLMFEVQPQQDGWRIAGRGSGHGAGMCQWGAQGRALAGQTYRQILGAYYPDATLVGAFGQ